MDPQANIQEQVAYARAIIAGADDANLPEDYYRPECVELAERVLALHEWRERGGFDPYGRS
jgi:hypothetical protein